MLLSNMIPDPKPALPGVKLGSSQGTPTTPGTGEVEILKVVSSDADRMIPTLFRLISVPEVRIDYDAIYNSLCLYSQAMTAAVSTQTWTPGHIAQYIGTLRDMYSHTIGAEQAQFTSETNYRMFLVKFVMAFEIEFAYPSLAWRR